MSSLHLVCTSVLLFISHRADIFPRDVGARPHGGGLALRLSKQQQTKTDLSRQKISSYHIIYQHHIIIYQHHGKNHKIIMLHNVISYVVAEKGQPNLKKMTSWEWRMACDRGWGGDPHTQLNPRLHIWPRAAQSKPHNLYVYSCLYLNVWDCMGI